MDEKNGVRMAPKSLPCVRGWSAVPITALGSPARGPGMERKDHDSDLGHVEFRVPFRYPSTMSMM